VTQSNRAAIEKFVDWLLLVGPAGLCLFLFPNFPCLILQIQPMMLGLCPIMPNHAHWIPKDAQVKCREVPKKLLHVPRKHWDAPKSPNNAQNFLELPKIPAYAGNFRYAFYAKSRASASILRLGPAAGPDVQHQGGAGRHRARHLHQLLRASLEHPRRGAVHL
jgi:hypothetical protein